MKVFVGNLSWDTDEQRLRELMEPHGNIEELRLITDRDTGRSRGFAFATFSNSDEGMAAIEALNGTEVDGRNLNVNEAREREPRQQRNRW